MQAETGNILDSTVTGLVVGVVLVGCCPSVRETISSHSLWQNSDSSSG